MRLIINGEARDCAAATLAELVLAELKQSHDGPPSLRGYATARNGAVVRKADWTTTILADGDRIEIVRAMQGG